LDLFHLTLRVVASGRHAVRVTTRGVQLSIGRPVEFASEATDVSALECALAAIGAEVVGGLRTFAERRRLVLDDVEAVVKARLEAPLVYVGVIGERGNPRLSMVAVKVYVSSPEEAHLIERAFVPDAPVRRRVLRRRARTYVRLPGSGGPRPALEHAGVQRAGLAQPLLGAGESRGPERRTGVALGGEVIRHVRRAR
jgi:hypothetical protein